MRPENDIRRFMDKAAVRTILEADKAVLDALRTAQQKMTPNASAEVRSGMRSIVMRSPFTRLAAAAVVIGAVVLGLFEFRSTGSKSGVVWAQVVQKVQASRGVTLRDRETTSFEPDDGGYSLKYFCPTNARTDCYAGGKIVTTRYMDLKTMTYTAVWHTRKSFLSRQITHRMEGFLEKEEDWLNPRYLVQTILSAEHRDLGQKTIDGVLCEGLETTDPRSMGPMPKEVTRLEVQMRLWVDVATQYPVRFESKLKAEAEGKEVSSEGVMDQFRWDVDLDPRIFEPNIPSGYEEI